MSVRANTQRMLVKSRPFVAPAWGSAASTGALNLDPCLVIFCVFFCFFFSSRRRHTRCLSDWSSDVCSSDLGRAAPPAAPAAALYAVVNCPWAVMAVVSPASSVPVSVPGGNPVIVVPGHAPTSPVTLVGAATVEVLVTVEPAKIPKPQPGVPNAMGDGQAVIAVVNIHTRACASPLPNWSCAPVVIVAVYWVSSARRFMGVKVATMSVASRETVPATEVAPAANVNVVAGEMIVAGLMALLNVAVTTAPWQTPIALPTGTTETTVGGVRGEPGFPAPEFLSGSLHPVATMSNRNAGNQILGLLYLGMTVILLLLGFMLPHRNLSTYEQLC